MIRRFAPTAVGVAAVGVVPLVMGFGRAISLVPLLAIAVVALAVAFRSHRTASVDVGWTGARDVARVSAEPTIAATGRSRSVAWNLARVEARELVTSVWFGAGLGMCFMVALLFGWVWVEDIENSWFDFFSISALICHPFAGFAVVAAHRNRTRSARDGCDELFDTCPATADERTLAHLATWWVGAVVCVTYVVGLAVLVASRNPRTYGPINHESVALVLACGVLGAGSVVLGVALGRWSRFALVPFVAVVVVGVASGRISQIGRPSWATDQQLGTFVAGPDVQSIYFPTSVWSRLAWLVALTVLVGALAVVGRARAATIVAGVAAVAVVVTGALVARPGSSGQVEEIVQRLVDPMASSVCVDAGPTVRACSFAEYGRLATVAADELAPVAAAVPRGVLDDVVFLTFFHDDESSLAVEVRRALDGRAPAVPAGALRLRFKSHPDNFDAARMRLAARAVGLPTEVDENGKPTVVAGQARGVIVFWLATRGLDHAHAANLVDETFDITADGSRDATNRGQAWPGLCHDEVGVLQWSPTDLRAARALLTLPDGDVARLLAADWARLVDPETTTDDLLVLAGLPKLGPPEQIEVREYVC